MYVYSHIYIFGFEDPAGWSWTYIERSICILYTIYIHCILYYIYTNAYRRRERNDSKTLVVWRLGHDAPRPYTALRTSGHGSPGESQKWRKGKHVVKRYWKTL